jgi:hypothetical protein
MAGAQQLHGAVRLLGPPTADSGDQGKPQQGPETQKLQPIRSHHTPRCFFMI